MTPVNWSELSNVGKCDVVKKDVNNSKIKIIEDKISDITNLSTNTSLSAKINKGKLKIRSITNLANTIALTTAENKIINVSN